MTASVLSNSFAADLEMLRALFAALKTDYAVIIHGYFDESGTHRDAPVTCVAGYLFEAAQELRFESEWREALDCFGIKRFHMSECAHGTGEFKTVSKKDRIEIETRLIGIIKRRTRMGIAVSISNDEYRNLASPKMADEGGAYILCLMWCIAGVTAWVNRNEIEGSISYFFENGHLLSNVADRVMKQVAEKESTSRMTLYGSHTFISKERAQGVQAADLLAWQWHTDWKHRLGNPRKARRADLESLIKSPHITSHLGGDKLYHMAASYVNGGFLPDYVRRFDFVE